MSAVDSHEVAPQTSNLDAEARAKNLKRSDTAYATWEQQLFGGKKARVDRQLACTRGEGWTPKERHLTTSEHLILAARFGALLDVCRPEVALILPAFVDSATKSTQPCRLVSSLSKRDAWALWCLALKAGVVEWVDDPAGAFRGEAKDFPVQTPLTEVEKITTAVGIADLLENGTADERIRVVRVLVTHMPSVQAAVEAACRETEEDADGLDAAAAAVHVNFDDFPTIAQWRLRDLAFPPPGKHAAKTPAQRERDCARSMAALRLAIKCAEFLPEGALKELGKFLPKLERGAADPDCDEPGSGGEETGYASEKDCAAGGDGAADPVESGSDAEKDDSTIDGGASRGGDEGACHADDDVTIADIWDVYFTRVAK